MAETKQKYYSLTNILKYNATYNMLIGERSNGKSYSVLLECLEDYVKTGHQAALLRRWDTDFSGGKGKEIWSALVANGEVERLTKGKWNTISYVSSKWYLSKYDKDADKYLMEEEPFAHAFSLNVWEHYKSSSYPKVKNIFFDEFMTRGYYLNEEFVIFMNTLSTIIRDRDGIRIFMAGNTVNKYCPYFNEMGLVNIKNMKKGTIDLYEYQQGLTVAVEYTDFPAKKKKSDKYFAFNNPKLNMITNGAWEIGMYPRLPHKYKNKNIKFKFFIIFDNEILQCELLKVEKCHYIYVHRKTTPIKDESRDLVYTQDYNPKPNYRRKLLKPIDNIDRKICSLINADKIFYQDNEVGEIFRNYTMWCKTDKGVI